MFSASDNSSSKNIGAETWEEVGGTITGPAVQDLQSDNASAEYLHWSFGDCKVVFSAARGPQVCKCQKGLRKVSGCVLIYWGGTSEDNAESRLGYSW